MYTKAPWRALSIMVLCFSASSHAQNQQGHRDRFALRNGEAEARLDADKRKPIKIYTSVMNGIIPGFSSPGLIDCTPGVAKADIFEIVPKAGFQEGAPFSFSAAVMQSAYKFMSLYNRTVFELRQRELKEYCPKVALGHLLSRQQ